MLQLRRLLQGVCDIDHDPSLLRWADCVTGSIPLDWFEAPKLQSLDLTANLFSGTIPASTVAITGLEGLLTGLQETFAMRRLKLANNLLAGTTPSGLWRFRLQACLGVPSDCTALKQLLVTTSTAWNKPSLQLGAGHAVCCELQICLHR